MVRVRKMAKFEPKNNFELSIPCERAHCKLQKNVRIVGIRPSKVKLWLIEIQLVISTSHSQLHESTEREKVSDKYPSFELVLNFVKNESLSVERLHALLQQRSKVARSTAQTYYFVAEVVRMMGVNNLFEVGMIM